MAQAETSETADGPLPHGLLLQAGSEAASRVDTLLQMGAIAKERRQKLVEAAAKAKAEAKARSDHKDSGSATAQSSGSAQHPAQVTDAEHVGGATATEKTGTTKAKKKVVKYPIKTKSKAAGAPPGASSAAIASAAPPPTVLDVEEDTETKDARSRSPRGVAPTVIDVEENTETKDARSRSPRGAETAPADPVLAGWRGGQGSYERIKPKPRDPPHPVLGLPAARNLEVKTMGERFSTRYPDAVEVAETYGTTACEGPGRVWELGMESLVGAQGKPTVNLMPASTPFRSPLDAELLEGWVEKAGDPEVYVVDWVRNGTPLGIERAIPTCGVYPTVPEQEQKEVDLNGRRPSR